MKKYIVIKVPDKNELLVFFGKTVTKVFFDLYLTVSGVKDISYFSCEGHGSRDTIDNIIYIAQTINSGYIDYKHVRKKTNEEEYCLFVGSNGMMKLLNFLFEFKYINFHDEIYSWIIGNLCNIPSCCIKKYIDFDGSTNDMLDEYLSQLNGKKDPFNLVSRGEKMGVASDIINFVPCSPQCHDSKKRLVAYRKYWKKMFDAYGMTASELKKRDIYMQKEGMALITYENDRSLS